MVRLYLIFNGNNNRRATFRFVLGCLSREDSERRLGTSCGRPYFGLNYDPLGLGQGLSLSQHIIQTLIACKNRPWKTILMERIA